jgi:hypothetical protein
MDPSASRKEMAKIIEGFRKEGERRRSWVALPTYNLPFSQILTLTVWAI